MDHAGKEFPIYSAEVLPQLKEATIRAPSAAVLAEIIRDGVSVPERMPLEPIYLREPHITVPKVSAGVTIR